MDFLKRIYNFFIIFLILLWLPIFCANNNQSNTSLLRGPGPLFSLGLNIFPKGQTIVSEELYYVKEIPHSSPLFLFNTLYYGITDRLSILFDIPIILKEIKVPKTHSRGIGNIILQSEYAFYQKTESDSRIQCTILANATLPTTQVNVKTDVLTTKALSSFLGVTTSNLSTLWYTYGDIGVYLSTTRHHFKLGNQVWYDLGAGRKIIERTHVILAALIEMSGIYERPDTINKALFLKTGGNRLFLGPTIRFNYDSLVIITGFQYAISDNTREDIRTKYRTAFSLSWIF